VVSSGGKRLPVGEGSSLSGKEESSCRPGGLKKGRCDSEARVDEAEHHFIRKENGERKVKTRRRSEDFLGRKGDCAF